MASDTLDPTKDLQKQVDSVNQSLQDILGRVGNLEKDQSTVGLSKIPQGPGSRLDSDTIDGINASYKPQPHTLVPLGPTGQFAASTIPSSASITLAGDVTGNSATNTVVKIHGSLLGTTTPSTGNLLIADGTDWDSVALSGDATIVATGTLTLANSGVTAGTYGDSSHVGSFTVDAKGRITSASNISIPATNPGGNSGDVQYNNGGVFGGSDNLFWDNTKQRLGINTTTPSRTLQLKGHDAGDGVDWPMIRLLGETPGANARFGDFEFYNGANNLQVGGLDVLQDNSGTPAPFFQLFADARNISGTPDSYVIFLTSTGSSLTTSFFNSQNKSYIKSNLRVGGTSNPSYALDATGDINTSGIYRVGGTQIASTNLSDGSTLNIKSNTICHFGGYFRTESGLTLPTTFVTIPIDAAITIKRITVDPVVISIGAGTGTVIRLTDGTTNCNVTLGPGASNATATFTTNYASGVTLSLKVQSDDNATPPTDLNVVVEYIIQ